MTLGENITRLRTQKNWSQGDLADALDISRQSVSKWETEVSRPFLLLDWDSLPGHPRRHAGPDDQSDAGAGAWQDRPNDPGGHELSRRKQPLQLYGAGSHAMGRQLQGQEPLRPEDRI